MATVAISFIMCTYYNVIITWALYYMFSSFRSELLWENCNNTWNTANCTDRVTNSSSSSTSSQQFFKCVHMLFLLKLHYATFTSCQLTKMWSKNVCLCHIRNKGKKGRLPLTCVIIAWSFNKWISSQKSASASNKTRINIVIILYAWTIITKQCYQSPNQLLLGLFACKQHIQVIGYQLSPFYLIWHE